LTSDALFEAARLRAAEFVREYARELNSYHQSGLTDAVRARLLIEFIEARERLTDIEKAAVVDAAMRHAQTSRATAALHDIRATLDWFTRLQRWVERRPRALWTVPMHLLLLLFIGSTVFLVPYQERELHIPIEIAVAPMNEAPVAEIPAPEPEPEPPGTDEPEPVPEPVVEPDPVPDVTIADPVEASEPVSAVAPAEEAGDAGASTDVAAPATMGVGGTDATGDAAGAGTVGR
jgi:hypothetical protein